MSLPRLFTACLVLVFAFTAGACASSKKKKDYETAVVRFMFESNGREVAGTARLPRSGTVISIAPKAQFTEYDIKRCGVVQNEFGPSLMFELTAEAAKDLFRTTATSQGRRIVTVINGRPVGAARINAPLGQGIIVTYVELDDADLEKLAKDITRTSEDLREELEKKTQ
ncbi:MAG: hypothetical protein MUE42_08550 [Opitutaceae bacterium]|jgi:preprotein translocase subunit SecD|nr:hypothetical protein [Opitutaceae bacterium]